MQMCMPYGGAVPMMGQAQAHSMLLKLPDGRVIAAPATTMAPQLIGAGQAGGLMAWHPAMFNAATVAPAASAQQQQQMTAAADGGPNSAALLASMASSGGAAAATAAAPAVQTGSHNAAPVTAQRSVSAATIAAPTSSAQAVSQH
jgi:hypothetical protein